MMLQAVSFETLNEQTCNKLMGRRFPGNWSEHRHWVLLQS